MELIADILLIAGALGAALYCIVLSRRLRRFNDLEKGVGGAIAVLSAQVDDMTKTLKKAQGAAIGSTSSLKDLTIRAESVSKRLEVLVAAMHDLPDPPRQPPAATPSAEPEHEQPATQAHAPAPAPPAPVEPGPPKTQPTQSELPNSPEPDNVPSVFRSQRSWSQEAAE
ncbi:hypothetical protein [Pseudoruegeria sp. HB172150]|uniref:hypothetical protein n=1 Tax=Pseudoruegeria sp. HB172150 TaxID=2721164 RepID=UPI0020A6372A|nr:hypothetical protein [Pseudoruegeria sp. HB172150]